MHLTVQRIRPRYPAAGTTLTIGAKPRGAECARMRNEASDSLGRHDLLVRSVTKRRNERRGGWRSVASWTQANRPPDN